MTMTDPLLQMQGMTDAQRLLFMSEYNQRRKDPTVGVLLALFLGGLGIHRFYLGQVGWGVFYLLFCWTFVPVFVALVELFLMSGRVRRYNERAAAEIAARVQSFT